MGFKYAGGLLCCCNLQAADAEPDMYTQAFGGDMSVDEVHALFQQAGEDSHGRVGVDNLANLLQQHQLEGNLFKIIKR